MRTRVVRHHNCRRLSSVSVFLRWDDFAPNSRIPPLRTSTNAAPHLEPRIRSPIYWRPCASQNASRLTTALVKISLSAFHISICEIPTLFVGDARLVGEAREQASPTLKKAFCRRRNQRKKGSPTTKLRVTDIRTSEDTGVLERSRVNALREGLPSEPFIGLGPEIEFMFVHDFLV